MKKMIRLLLVAGMLATMATAALAADQLVSLYVGDKLVKCDPSARVRDGVTYAPLRPAAEAVGMEVEWDAGTDTASLCAPGRCVLPIKASQGIVVNGGLLIPVRLLGQALGRPVSYDPKTKAVRVK
ncbi:MAG: copper amine oxidase N-terminal domain-containing protein [Armatimonadota bacterium]